MSVVDKRFVDYLSGKIVNLSEKYESQLNRKQELLDILANKYKNDIVLIRCSECLKEDIANTDDMSLWYMCKVDGYINKNWIECEYECDRFICEGCLFNKDNGWTKLFHGDDDNMSYVCRMCSQINEYQALSD